MGTATCLGGPHRDGEKKSKNHAFDGKKQFPEIGCGMKEKTRQTHWAATIGYTYTLSLLQGLSFKNSSYTSPFDTSFTPSNASNKILVIKL